jgi:type IV secretion system protein VirD4
MPTLKLIVNLRGNKPLLLDKVIYTEHPLSKKLKDSFISDYKPNWTKNHPDKIKIKIKEKKKEQQQSDHKEKLSWDNF